MLESRKMGSKHAYVQKYFRVVEETMLKSGRKKGWLQDFGGCKTDFQRVCFLLKKLEAGSESSGKRGVEVLGLPPSKSELTKASKRSDGDSEKLHSLGKRVWESGNLRKALAFFTAALFHAQSDQQKTKVLTSRARLLVAMECFWESLRDGEEILKLASEPMQVFVARVILAESCFGMGRNSEAKSYCSEAMNMRSVIEIPAHVLRLLVVMLTECAKSGDRDKSFEPEWRCFRAQPPQVGRSKGKTKKEKEPEAAQMATEDPCCQLASAPEGLLRLRNTGNKRGWTLEVMRDVGVGEVLISEKPYASTLLSEFFLMYCYHCYKRCLNLIPCEHCPYVGFCSPECREAATRQTRGGGGGGRHVEDCGGGLVACLQLDSYAGWPREMRDSLGGPVVAHLAFSCIAATDPARLLSLVLTRAPLQAGLSAHQAFSGAAVVRETPPRVMDPSDYEAAAWLDAGSERRSRADLWQRTVAAVFLTYCLSLGGYPMEWFDESEFFYSPPTPGAEASKQPKRLPASWVAACVLYHLQSVSTNGHSYFENVFLSLKKLDVSKAQHIVSCLYPTLSLVNHACDPCTFRVCTGGGASAAPMCFLAALRPLKAGTELTDCYVDCFSLADKATRQKELNSRYLFQCTCEACTNDWPTLVNVQARKALLALRCPQCSKEIRMPARRCVECRSTKGVVEYERLVNRDIPEKMALVSEGMVTPAVVREAGVLLGELDRLVKRPATHFDSAQELFKMAVDFTQGLWTLEPWLKLESSDLLGLLHCLTD